MILHDHLISFQYWTAAGAAEGAQPSAHAGPGALIVPASPAAVFNLLADIESLPRWLPEFCERLRIVAGRWVGLTSFGELVLELDADSQHGTVELRAGEEAGKLERILTIGIQAAPRGETRLSYVCPLVFRLIDPANERRRIFALGLARLPARFPRDGSPDVARADSVGRWGGVGQHPLQRADAPTQRGPGLAHLWSGLGASLFERLRQ